jgi:hypothetical protein
VGRESEALAGPGMSSHDAERAWVAAVLDARAGQLADVTASTRAELHRLRESWASGYDQELADHEQRMGALRDETRAYLTSLTSLTGEAEPAPVPAAAAADPLGAPTSPSSAGRPDGHGLRPQQTPLDPSPGPSPVAGVERDLTADEIRALTWTDYSALRTRTGIGNASRGMFG